MLRQGDVLLIAREKIPSEAQLEDGCILAYGEATGHVHEIKKGARIWVDLNDQGRRYLEILDMEVDLQHQEHAHLKLLRDSSVVYEIVRQRAYTPLEVHHVQD